MAKELMETAITENGKTRVEVEEVEEINYKKATFQFMVDYINECKWEDREWFKSVALDEEGNYHHLKAKKEFFKRYFPEYLPKKKDDKKPVNAKEYLKNW